MEPRSPLQQALLDLWQGPQNLVGLTRGYLKTGKAPTLGLDPQGNSEFRFIVPGEDPVAIGSTITMAPDSSPVDLAHERVHTEQSRRFGPGYIPARLISDLMSSHSVGNSYDDNPLEDEAYLRTEPAGSQRLSDRLSIKKALMKGNK